MTSPGLRIAAIHNGELDRAPARQVIEASEPLTASSLEYVDQSPFPIEPDVHALREWRRRQAELEVRWAAYLGRPKFPFTSTAGRWVFSAQVRTSSEVLNTKWQVRQVEKAVTAKHAAAWRDFNSSTDSELLVVESDAVMTETTVSVLSTLLQNQTMRPRYVNLAGGLDPKALGIDHLAVGSSENCDQLISYSRPVTNTSCAYLINQPMADRALDYLERRPIDEDLGIDWLWNAIFLDNLNTDIDCLHAQPPAITHGSIRGITKSWHPDR